MFSGCPSVRLSVRLFVRPSVRLSVCPSGHVFLYYANMVQEIEFIIYTNIQPLRQKLLTKGQGHRSKVKVEDGPHGIQLTHMR